MNELRILIARLSWPSTSSRWWAMQELAARLGEPLTKTETESALLLFLHSRKLEAEVVEVLWIFWMAAQGHDYTPSIELEDSIPKPSLLSDILVESFGLSITPIQMNLQEVPKDFEMPNDFESVQGTDLPRIFRTYMRLLADKTGLPFLRQMSFEWAENSATYPHAPYQADAWHFSRPLGDGFVSQYSARAALRSISAYLRTLVLAKRIWGYAVGIGKRIFIYSVAGSPDISIP